jgi:hypothetical protein
LFEGLLNVDVITRPLTADGDPYYGIDYVELSQTRIQQQVPEPTPIVIRTCQCEQDTFFK